MKTETMSFTLAIIVFFCMVSVSFSDVRNKSDDIYTQKLQYIADSVINYYRNTKNFTEGGILIKVITPNNDYFVTSGMPGATSNSHFRIASITKTFTAAAIMLLYQQGRLNINDVVTSNIPGTNTPYLPDDENYNVPYKNDITINLLLEHRAGVFDITMSPIPKSANVPYAGEFYPSYIMDQPGNKEHSFTFDELVGIVAKNNLSYFKPDESYHYSNGGYEILGKIIERVSGLTYSDFIETNFIIPLGLKNTYSIFTGSDVKIPENAIESYLVEKGITENTTEQNMSAHVAEGNIISSPDDITKWIRLLLTGESGIYIENIDLMKKTLPIVDPYNTGAEYGLGLAYLKGLGYGHDGAHECFLSNLCYNPETDITVLTVFNFWVFNKNEIFLQIGSVDNISLNAVNVFK